MCQKTGDHRAKRQGPLRQHTGVTAGPGDRGHHRARRQGRPSGQKAGTNAPKDRGDRWARRQGRPLGQETGATGGPGGRVTARPGSRGDQWDG